MVLVGEQDVFGEMIVPFGERAARPACPTPPQPSTAAPTGRTPHGPPPPPRPLPPPPPHRPSPALFREKPASFVIEGSLEHPPPSECSKDYSVIATARDATNDLTSVAWSGQLLAAGGADRKVRVYDGEQDDGRGGTHLNWGLLIEFSDGRPSAELLHSHESPRKRVGASLPVVFFWELGGPLACLLPPARGFLRPPPLRQDYKLVATLEAATDTIYCVAWSGRLLAAGGLDKTVQVYDGEQAGWAKGGVRRGVSWPKNGIDLGRFGTDSGR